MRTFVTIAALAGISIFASCGNNNTATENSATKKVDTTSVNPANSTDAVGKQTVTEGTDRGRELFQQKCSSCHGLGGDAQSNNAANLPHSVLDSLSITQTIRNGRGTMPMFKDAIADTDIAHLAVYVKSLRK